MEALLMPLILSLLLSVSCAFAKAKPKLKPHTPAVKPQLLKYSQIMRLSKTKRITYLRRIGHLLVMLERPQAKFESADAREILKQFAAFLPEAYAEDALLDVPAETAEPQPQQRLQLKPLWPRHRPALAQNPKRSNVLRSRPAVLKKRI
jgi:hypothetical protein